jgi:type III pantothenate kinase
MNLIVDVGNTKIKFAVFKEVDLIEKMLSDSSKALETLELILQKYDGIKKTILSSTAKVPVDFFNLLSSKLQLIQFSHESQLNFVNNYTTPDTLGLDRIALVSAAASIFPQTNVLVIDAGTCITFDFIDKKGIYQGGAISPGLQMRFKAMHSFTENLPFITNNLNVDRYIGKSTEEAMKVGVVKSICYEIDGYIEDYRTDYEDLTVVLTGGDYNLLSASIKNSIFATQNFLLKGLNQILQLNSN